MIHSVRFITVSGNGFGPGGESAFGAARSGSANPARFETKTQFETKPWQLIRTPLPAAKTAIPIKAVSQGKTRERVPVVLPRVTLLADLIQIISTGDTHPDLKRAREITADIVLDPDTDKPHQSQIEIAPILAGTPVTAPGRFTKSSAVGKLHRIRIEVNTQESAGYKTGIWAYKW